MFSVSATLQVGPFRVRDMRYEPSAHQERHAHDEFQISFLMRGRMEECTPAGTRVAVPGQVIVKRSGTYHENRFGPEGVRILCVDGEDGADLRDAIYFPSHGGAPAAAAMNVVRAFRDGEPLDDAISDLVAALPCERESRSPIDIALARRAATVIRDRFATPISLSDVAVEVGTHRTHLARQFRRAFGTTVGEYLRSCRAAYAAELIATTDIHLTDIALQSGFADQSHLTRSLRSTLGISPRRFRVLVNS
jgi:AraC family transcriptional regulator